MGPGKMVVATAMRAEASLVYGAELAYPASKTESERPPKRLDIGEVKKTFSDFDPIFQHVLSAAKDAWLWRLWQLPTDFSWVNEEGTIVVTGDAAHAMLPHAAMVLFPP
jgi:salicylate hydroxylase